MVTKLSRSSIIFIIIVLSQYSYAFNVSQFDSLYSQAKEKKSILIAEKALESALTTGQNSLIAKSFYLIGYYQDKSSMYYEALNSYFDALKYYRLSENPTRQSIVLRNIGLLYFKAGFLDKALTFYNEAIQLASINVDDKEMAQLHYYVGMLLRTAGKIDEALQALNESAEMFKRLDNLAMLNEIKAEKYLIAVEQENYGQALALYSETNDHTLNTDKDTYELMRQYNNIGYVMLKNMQIDSARSLFMKGISVANEGAVQGSFVLSTLLGNMSKVYEYKNNNDSSIFMIEQAFSYLNREDYNIEYLGNAKRLADYYEEKQIIAKSREYTKAIYEYAHGLAILQEKLRQADIRYQVEAASYKHESQLRFEAQKQERELMWWSYGGIALLVFSVAFYFYYRYYSLRKEAKRILGA